MSTFEQFEDLEAWKESRKLVSAIYEVTKRPPFSDDWNMKGQIRDAAVSIMSNIAEGFERGSNKEFIQFLHISKGSSAEVRSLLYAALDQKYLEYSAFEKLRSSATSISRQLKGFISYLNQSTIRKRTKPVNNPK
jgi:four helix bundle protein